MVTFQVPMDCSIVIVSWNVRDLLRDCLRSLPDAAGARSYEVIAVDGASGDGSVEMLRREFPAVRVKALDSNVGFAVGNNVGMVMAGGRYVLLLNPDTVMRAGSLDALIGYMDAQPWIGLAGPRLLNPDGSPQSSRRRFPTTTVAFVESTPLQAFLGKLPALRNYYVEQYGDDAPQEVDWVSGACMIVRRRVIGEVGGFDPGYFMYSEELDLCRRIKAAGWRIGFVPAAAVVHFGGQSSGQDVPARHIRFNRAKVRYFARWQGRRFAGLLRLWLLLLYVWQAVVEGGKWLVGHKRELRRERLQLIAHVLRSGLRM